MEDLANEAGDATNKGEREQVYKRISCKYRAKPPTRQSWKEDKQEVKCAEYFSEVLKRTPPTIEAKVQDTDTDLNVSTTPPEKEEIMAAIRSLKSGKAPASTQNFSTQSQSL